MPQPTWPVTTPQGTPPCASVTPFHSVERFPSGLASQIHRHGVQPLRVGETRDGWWGQNFYQRRSEPPPLIQNGHGRNGFDSIKTNIMLTLVHPGFVASNKQVCLWRQYLFSTPNPPP